MKGSNIFYILGIACLLIMMFFTMIYTVLGLGLLHIIDHGVNTGIWEFDKKPIPITEHTRIFWNQFFPILNLWGFISVPAFIGLIIYLVLFTQFRKPNISLKRNKA